MPCSNKGRVGSACLSASRDGYDEPDWFFNSSARRPLKRSIQRLIQDPLALAILNGDFGEDDVVIVDRDSDKAAMRFEKKAAVAA